jgi:hypothetical protein
MGSNRSPKRNRRPVTVLTAITQQAVTMIGSIAEGVADTTLPFRSFGISGVTLQNNPKLMFGVPAFRVFRSDGTEISFTAQTLVGDGTGVHGTIGAVVEGQTVYVLDPTNSVRGVRGERVVPTRFVVEGGG